MSHARTLIIGCAAVLALTVLVGVAGAQTAYRIEPSDELRVEVWEKPDLTREVTVREDGTITMPLIGEVRVTGNTPSELEGELARKLSLYDRGITQVSVTVSEYNSKTIYVLGAVARPGKYSAWPIPSIWDLIRDAGGPTDDAYLGGVQVIREGETGDRDIMTVDLSQMWGRGLPSDLPALQPDDTINIPKKVVGQTWPDVIYVMGAVEQPGVVQKEGAIDLVGGVLLAGGPNKYADLTKVTIVRRGPGATRTMLVNMENYLLEGDEVSNPLLMPGDTITVAAHRGSFLSLSNVRGLVAVMASIAGIFLLVDNLRTK